MPKVSIVTSTFNRVEKLKRCINSVKSQSFTDYEHIIIDDRSTDGTREYVESLNDEKIIYIRRKTNFKNDTRPKNEAILASSGKYIAFLDDDNEYRQDHLQALVMALESSSSVSMVYGDRWIIDETQNILPQIGIFSEFDPHLILKRNYIDTSDVLIRRETLFDVGGFDEQYKKYIDWNLWVRMVKAGYVFKRVPLILTNYYLSDDSKSRRKEDERAFNIPAWNPYDCVIKVPYLGEQKEPKVAIYTITYNRLSYTNKFIELINKTSGYKFDHFIVDNGSTDGTIEYLKTLNIKKVILNKANYGIGKASNIAIEQIMSTDNYNVIVKVDNDCMFRSFCWLEKMIELWKLNRKIAMSCYIEGLKDSPGGAPRIRYGKIGNEFVGVTNHLGGICVFTDVHAYKNFRWNDNDFLHGMQDVEFSKHLKEDGYEMVYLENYFASHGPDGTEKQYKDFPEYFEKRKYEKTTRNKS